METIKIHHERVKLTLHADAYAYCSYSSRNEEYENKVFLLSVAGPERVIKALHGTLHSNNTKATISIGYKNLKPLKEGYRTYKICIDEETRTWHMIAIAKTEGFIPAWDTNALWNELRKERFSTPVIKPWMPWIKQQIEEHGSISLTKHNCNPILLAPDVVTESLDKLISHGLKQGDINIG